MNTSWVSVGMPRSAILNTDRLLSRTRSTQLSPQIVATVDTRMSISRPSTVIVICPSWGRRRSTMFISAMILRRLTSAGAMLDGSSTASCSAPSMRNRTRSCWPWGSMWMSDARSRIAWVMRRLTTWTTGASASVTVWTAASASRWGLSDDSSKARTCSRMLPRAR